MIQATLLGMCLLSAAPVDLRAATQALDDLQYQAALDRLPGQGSIKEWRREEVLEWFSTRALALLGLKREVEARQGFEWLFSLAPEWALPDQYGPRVRTFVSAARADAVRSGTVSLRFEGGLLRARGDSFGYARELEVFWREPNGATQQASLPLQELQPAPWPRERRLEVWGRVLGLQKSTLSEWGSENAPIRLEPMAVVNVEGGTPSRGLGGLGIVGLAAGGAALISTGVGTGFALSSQEAERTRSNATRDGDGRITSISQRDAFALDARVQREAGTATVFFVTAAAFATAGVGLVLFDRLRVVPTPGGALISVPLDASFAIAGGAR
ncbi:MAG: hypothetical protein Q8N23_17545 [Archangium sp.]|nr:hypothetical protein [Archangium sp.]MDP3572909.1 hypothetical protein [Archangium sp.]